MLKQGEDNTNSTISQESKDMISYQSHTYRLDNAATLFSLVSSSRIPCMFRLSASVDTPIKIHLLQKALDNIIVRFPYYRVNQRTGFFWYYWGTNFGKPKVIMDTQYPCQKMPIRKEGIFPFRVRAYQNRVAVEFHHSLTDATGSVTFLKSIMREYLRLDGTEVSEESDIFKPEDKPDLEEYEDAFKKNYRKIIPEPTKQIKAFHLPYKLSKKGVYRITSGIIPVDEILKKSKEYNITLTEYLTSIYLESLQKILFSFSPRKLKRRNKPIRLMVPVNLRRMFPSRTMRNFSLYVTPGIDTRLGEHTFEEIMKSVHHYMRLEINDKFISQQIKRNVRGELHPLMRATPFFIKKMGGKSIYNKLGENLYSGVITNLGKISFPESMEEKIQDIQFIPAPSPTTKTGCAVVSFKENLYINFGSVIKENSLERNFFRKIVKEGISVKVETN